MSWTASIGGVVADSEEAMDKIVEAFHEFVAKVRPHSNGEPWGGLTGTNNTDVPVAAVPKPESESTTQGEPDNSGT